jgi:hypothetical protein
VLSTTKHPLHSLIRRISSRLRMPEQEVQEALDKFPGQIVTSEPEPTYKERIFNEFESQGWRRAE